MATAVIKLQHAAPGDVTIRLDAVSFIDMSGLGILVGARSAQIQRADRLIITGANARVRRTSSLAALADLLDARN